MKDRAGRQEEEYSRLKKKLQEDQLRLNLLETRLQNESLKQDAGRLKYGAEMADRAKSQVPILPCCVEAELYMDPQYITLKEENRKLQEETGRLETQILSEMEVRKAVEKEKQELFKILLETDPKAVRLFEDRMGKASAEEGNREESKVAVGPEEPSGNTDDPPGQSGGERKDR